MVAFGAYLVWLWRRLVAMRPDGPPALFQLTAAVFAAQLAVVLLARIALQLAHLVLAHALWLALLALWIDLRSEPVVDATESTRQISHDGAVFCGGPRQGGGGS